jgi:hypothetical protein
MSSSGFASSTMKSALLLDAITPVSVIFRNSAPLLVAATITCAGVIPAATISAISKCGAYGVFPISPDDDAHAGGVHPGKVARLDAEGGLGLGPVRVALLKRGEICWCERRPQPLEIRHHSAIGQVGAEHQVRTLLHERHELIVDVPVAHAVREGVDARAHQPPGVLQGEDMRDGPQPPACALRRSRRHRVRA